MDGRVAGWPGRDACRGRAGGRLRVAKLRLVRSGGVAGSTPPRNRFGSPFWRAGHAPPVASTGSALWCGRPAGACRLRRAAHTNPPALRGHRPRPKMVPSHACHLFPVRHAQLPDGQRFPGGRVFRPARAQRRGQDHADQHPGRLARATSGRVLVQGSDVQADYAGPGASWAWCRRNWCLTRSSTCARRCAFQSGYFGVKHNDDWIDELLHSLGLADKANANMRQLSGGMKRRVLVAPGAGAQAARHRARRTHGRRGCGVAPDAVAVHRPPEQSRGNTVLLTTHYLEEAEALCGRIAMLKRAAWWRWTAPASCSRPLRATCCVFKTDAAAARTGRQGARHRAHRAVARAMTPRHRAPPGRLREAGVEVQDM
jgi:ABC-2 type transport system ATP-binding protein